MLTMHDAGVVAAPIDLQREPITLSWRLADQAVSRGPAGRLFEVARGDAAIVAAGWISARRAAAGSA